MKSKIMIALAGLALATTGATTVFVASAQADPMDHHMDRHHHMQHCHMERHHHHTVRVCH